jgi:uncharacterized integral membrane protein (TIGR00698 family)
LNLRDTLPGLLLSVLVALAAAALGSLETGLLGRAWLEPLVLAILLGMLVGNAVRLPNSFQKGISFSAKFLLDVAVALLGATLSWAAVAALGAKLFLLIVLVVILGLLLAFLIARALGLGGRLALLIAAGSAICGNSAIAAIAPLLNAEREEVAAAIALTALIGVVTVLTLPLAVLALGMELPTYAVLAGLTVYAVPQVVAATASFGTATIALATLVKLARVVMLGPITVLVALFAPAPAGDRNARRRPVFYLPWFIVAFAILSAARSGGWITEDAALWLGHCSKKLATDAMAALGLGVRLSTLREVGPKVAVASASAATLMLVLASAAIQFV